MRPDDKIDIKEILKDLDKYQPRRQGWTWRERLPQGTEIGPFTYQETASGLKRSIPLPAASAMGQIDPQPDCIITSEIASGRFEDDIRRFRMAAWHGADHMMVIRTAGQSHFDGLIEGTPEGIGGVPITRKQLRASRKALDLIEDEVGRPLNFHSYVSGVAGPEIGVLFAEEGVNGAHQDPQYNILYRNVNMVRSFVDAAVAKKVMAFAGMAQIDGAHNANATAREAWKVMPELLVQHAINSVYSLMVGIPKENICLSTVPPTAPPAPAMYMDLPYAIALRELFSGYRFRAQMNTRYIESDTREATVTHTLNILLSRLTSAHIQSTITPDEGRNVPWHYNSISAIKTAKQALLGLDGVKDLLSFNEENLREKIRELKERAILFMEEILACGGYFQAVEKGFFVDSGYYPERNDDGISRSIEGGVAKGSIIPRKEDYMAPVCAHFGENHLQEGLSKPCDLIGGCTLCHRDKITYIDELDEEDNVHQRLEKYEEEREKDLIRPEVEWERDGMVNLHLFLPVKVELAEVAALKMAEEMGLKEPQIIHREVMHPAEGTFLEVKGRIEIALDPKDLVIPKKEEILSQEEIREYIQKNPMKVVTATVGEDEHSVGMREITDIKHGGLEAFGIKATYLGTSVPISKVVDAAIEINARAILISTIITHNDIHRINMRRLNQLCQEKGIRSQVVLIAGGTQVNNEMAIDSGLDAGFGRGTKGIQVASFLVKKDRGDRD